MMAEQERLTLLEAEVQRLCFALIMYGDHLKNCHSSTTWSANGRITQATCECGFLAEYHRAQELMTPNPPSPPFGGLGGAERGRG